MKLYTIILIMLFMLIHIICTRFTYFTGIKHYEKDVYIYDLGHSMLPNFSKDKIILFLKDCISVLVLCFGFGVLTEFIEYFIVILVIRHLFTIVTVLPKTVLDPNSKPWFQYYYYVKGHCYDKIFSGHFAISVLLSLILYKRGIVTNVNLLVFYNLLNAFLILSTHSHYTIDLLVSAVVVLLVYQNNIKLSLTQ